MPGQRSQRPRLCSRPTPPGNWGFSLGPVMLYTPHDYQQNFLSDYLRWIDSNEHPYALYTSPTGTGKSVMELMALEADPHAMLITPRVEIVGGMLEKLGMDKATVDGFSVDLLSEIALAYRITTPIRLRNMLARGELQTRYDQARQACGFPTEPLRVERLLVDEGHHLLAETYADLRAYLPRAKMACLTATGFRGTPKQTDEFLKIFDNHVRQILTLKQASARGLFSTPRPEIWPLVDDDLLEVKNGEITVTSATDATNSVIDHVGEKCRQFYDGERYDIPTMFALPSTASVHAAFLAFERMGLPVGRVTEETPRPDRAEIFRATVDRRLILLQINVVSEGVDLPIRRLIDMRPTMSPVYWMQLVGRITRPGGSPHYICCNRNLERHGYLMEGLWPPAAFAQSQQLFGGPSARAPARAIGLEGLGRFAAAELPLGGGLKGYMYNLTSVEGFKRRDIVILCHPAALLPVVAVRESTTDPVDPSKTAWGRFKRVEGVPDIQGYASAPASKDLTPRQSAWWKREAARYGLDSSITPNKRSFAALPVLKDLRVKLAGG